MSLPRLRLENCSFDTSQNLWHISHDEAHHLVRVRRLYTGSLVEGLLCGADGDICGKKILLKLECLGTEVFAREISHAEEKLEGELVLLLALLKGDQWEDSLRFAAQTGVSQIVPLIAERSVPRISPLELPRKMSRWEKILDEATKQSSAIVPPRIAKPVKFCDFDFATLPPQRLAALLTSEAISLKQVTLDGSTALAIGPEGDWSQSEAQTLLGSGFTPITLGKRILKASTAVAVACGAISILR